VAYAFEESRRDGAKPARMAAVFGVFFTLFFLAATYLRRFGNARTRLLRMQLGLFTAMTGLVVVAKALLLFTALPEMWIPLATVPMWVALSFDRRTAFVVNVMLAFMAASLLLFDLPLLTVFITRGLASSIFFRNKKHPWQMVPAGLGGGVVACGLYAAIRTIFEGSYSALDDVMEPLASPMLACVGGGGLAGLLGVMLKRPAERLLGGVSRDRLIELTDLDQPLLQKMANEAPGSWEHARAMANLAEAAAAAINADSLLTRVGAYYHDLGKTVQPKYFVENLLPGERSPHDDLDPDVSADAIMAHVVQGAKILRDGGVPEPVVEFAYTHHGTQTIEYFWHRCRERGNPKNLREDFFRYPGMKPQTKETAILMLVDSIEAASRTIQPPDKTKFDEMIQRVVFTKLRSGQLDESGLTLEDVRTITLRMSDTLVNMYHGRIKYPWQREGSQGSIKTQARKPN
jgi:putative nucleotidyltransferase with HDIG domain